MSVLEQLERQVVERRRKRQSDQTGKFLTLVRAVADGDGDGKAPGVDEVDAILDSCGKGIEDLRAAVAVQQQRRTLREKIDAYEAAQAELPDVEAKMKAARAEFDAAQRKFDGAMAPLRQREDEIQRLRVAAQAARRNLLDNVQDDVLLQREAELKERRQQLHEEISRRRKRVGYLMRKIETSETELAAYLAWEERPRYMVPQDGSAYPPPAGWAGEAKHRHNIETQRGEVAELEKTVAELSKEEAEINRELDGIEQLKLQP